jgi:hypothetical protein
MLYRDSHPRRSTVTDTAFQNLIGSFLRPLATIKPDLLSPAVDAATNQVFGAARCAHLYGHPDVATVLQQLHTELTTVVCAHDFEQQRRLVDALLVRWV